MISKISFLKKHQTSLILIFILLLGLFFRTYQIVERFEFAHDGDLYSWTVKDILVNHHPRLIGQLTSAPGIFIGGLFYYLLIPFFLFTQMDPIGVTYFAVMIGLSTIFSFYFVLSKLFKNGVGLIAAFLYAVLLTTVNFDRWVVPTITTNLWVIWYFYAVIKITRGDYKVLPLLGILVGLVWHVHIALIPTLIAIPVAILLARKMPSLQQIIRFVIVLLITSLPLIIFEIRHGFGQTQSLINNFIISKEGTSGIYKLIPVIHMVSKNIGRLFLEPLSFTPVISMFLIMLILFSSFLLIKKKLLSYKEFTVFLVWILGVVTFFGLSKSPISEYYFSNINTIFIAILSLIVYFVFRSFVLGKFFILVILILLLTKNAYYLINQDYYNKGYVEKKAAVSFINKDASVKGFPCIGISYITAPGENVGFRYLFYLGKMHLVHPSLDIPVYNIVIPDELALKEVSQKFGHIGVIPPTTVPSKETIEKSCQTPDTNLTDSMFGYVE